MSVVRRVEREDGGGGEDRVVRAASVASGAADPAEQDAAGEGGVSELAPEPPYAELGRVGDEAAASPGDRRGAAELRFGELAVFQRFVTEAQLEEALQVQQRLLQDGRRHKIGKIMVKLGQLSTTQAKYVLRLQRMKDPIEGYKLLERRGQGGMGVVYRAVQKSLRREVALKVLAPRWAAHSRFLKRFFREAKLAGSLNHPNIVSAIDVGECGGLHYYAMEYVDGWSVAEMLAEEGPLEEDEALDIVLQIAKALEHASARHIVHRDIKPENILVTPNGVAKLTDLGLSKQLTSDCSITTEGKTLGTPFYVSPELARGVTDVDVRSDIYSLGATLYHMLAGEPPFVGDNPAAIMARHIAENPLPIRRRVPGLRRSTAKLLERMMHKDPEQRYGSATELVHDLIAIRKGRDPFESERRSVLESSSGRQRAVRDRRGGDERQGGGGPWRRWRPAALIAAGGVGCALAFVLLWIALAPDGAPGGQRRERAAAATPSSPAAGASAARAAAEPWRVRYVATQLEKLDEGGELDRLLAQERYGEARRRLEELREDVVGTGYESKFERIEGRLEAGIRDALRAAIEQAQAALAAGKPELALDYLEQAADSDDPTLNERRDELLTRVRAQLALEHP